MKNAKNTSRSIAILLFCILTSTFLITGCAQPVAENGDTLTFDYVGKLENGTLFDTTIERVARETGTYDENDTYTPLIITLGDGKVIRGLEEELTGMKKGETKTVTIPPIEAYGKFSPTKIVSIPIKTTRPLIIEANNTNNTRNASIGQVVRLKGMPWLSVIINITPEKLIIKQEPENGSQLQTSLGPATILVNEENMTIHLDLKKNGLLQTENGIAIIKEANETNAILDFNHPLAGKTLTFTVTLLDIKKKEK